MYNDERGSTFLEIIEDSNKLCFDTIFQYVGSLELYNMQFVCTTFKSEIINIRNMHLSLIPPKNPRIIFQNAISAILKNDLHKLDSLCLKYKKYIGDKTYVYETDNLFYIVKNIKKNSNMLKILHINDIRN